jgi:osmotically-inducible protein OsmY
MKFLSGKSTLRLLGALLLAGTVLVIVITSLSFFHLRDIELELQREISGKLEQAGFEVPTIEVNGREVTFSGDVEARIDRQQMVTIIQAIDGVDNVIDQRRVTNFARARNFELHSYAGITTVEGELPSAGDVEIVVNAIRSHFGVDPLGANLRIGPAVRRPPWLDDLSVILKILEPVTPLEIDYVEQTLTVRGVVPSSKQRSAIIKAVKSHLDERTTFVSAIKLADKSSAANLRIEYKRGAVTLLGTLPEQAFADELVANLRLAFAVESVDNRVKIDPLVRHGSWLESTLRVIFPLAVTHWVELDIKEDEVIITGEVAADAELEIVNEQLRENFGYGTKIVNLIKKANK